MTSAHYSIFPILFFSFISFMGLSYSVGNNTILCPEIERESLLSFKQSFKHPENMLSSWDGEAKCCTWEGVTCNNITGHVYQLHLPNMRLDGKINSSLLNLKHLSYLDLSGNDLLGGTMPSFIGSFAKLEYLDLSGTGFYGKVPHTIGNLSNLRTLDLSGTLLEVDSFEWLIRLPQLQYLNMDFTNLSKANNWAQVINSLPSLLELHFEFCSLDLMAPLDYVNVTSSLNHLYLSSNDLPFSIAIPPWIFQIPSLVSLVLSSNSFVGPIPTISNATKLQHLDLSINNLNSSIPDWFFLCEDLEFVDISGNLLTGAISNSIANLTSLKSLDAGLNKLSGKFPREMSNLCNMQSLDLSFNNLQGEILGNMSECFLESLEVLELVGNKLSGHLTNQFGEFKSLRRVSLRNNSLSGVIPITIGNLASLESLDLSDNKLTGTLPENFGQLFNLQYLYIDNNLLEGVVSETHFANLTKLKIFSASGNQLTLKVRPNWIPPFQLLIIRIASWNLFLGIDSLSWIEKQKDIWVVDLSNTGISGNLPSWGWKVPNLKLSHNHLHGNIRIGDTATELDISDNSFSGDISHFLCNTTYQTYQMKSLYLGGNQFGGEFPDCWEKWPALEQLNLGNNNLSGSIPNSIGFLANLGSLKLYGNRLSGEIPYLMHNCTELQQINLSDNDLTGSIPQWVGTHLVQLKVLILSSNKLSGKISPEICLLNFLQILDLSDNKFSGVIPRCLSNLSVMATVTGFEYGWIGSDRNSFTKDSASVVTKGSELEYGNTLYLVTNINLSKNNLSGNIPKELASLVRLRSLNLSQNSLTGSMPEKIGDMKQLESLDLSMNKLSGQIPQSMSLLSFLSYVNLSYNKLTGEIPKSTQLMGLDASSFTGNSLCGPPLTINCSHDGDEGRGQKEDKEEEGAEESKIEWLYVVVSLGYAIGFSAVCSALVIKRSWREAYFGMLESVWDKLYVYVCIKYKKLLAREESG